MQLRRSKEMFKCTSVYQVANFWCSVDILLKLKNRLDISQLGVICLITTFLARYTLLYIFIKQYCLFFCLSVCPIITQKPFDRFASNLYRGTQKNHEIALSLVKYSVFIPVSRIFDNKDDIFIFSRNVRKSSASENYFKKQNQKYYKILNIYECVEK